MSKYNNITMFSGKLFQIFKYSHMPAARMKMAVRGLMAAINFKYLHGCKGLENFSRDAEVL
jgi:hypothetical protein